MMPNPEPFPPDAGVLDLLEQSLPFAGLPSFMRLPYTRILEGVDLVVAGVPFDSGTLNRSGTRYGPRAIREQSIYAASLQPVYPWDYVLTEHFKLIDFGDVAAVPGSGAVEMMLQITEAVASAVFAAGAGLLTLGGDHTTPYGPVRAAAKHYGKLALVHLDAHQDSFASDQIVPGSQFINHSTFANDLLKEGHIAAEHSLQVYIRTCMPAAQGDGYRIIYANDALEFPPEQLAEIIKTQVGTLPVYFTLDIDALDSACAPGTGSPVPGGPNAADMRRLLKALDGLNVVAADLVEVNPLYDPAQTTAITAAFLAIDLLYLLGQARRNHG
jgi:agmatinase